MNARLAILSVCLSVACSHPPAFAKAAGAPAGYTALFDGATLGGWKGDPRVWSVADGAIVGKSENGIGENTFLIHGQRYANFELHYKYRFKSVEKGNSGVQFRSYRSDPSYGAYDLSGLQANVTLLTDRPERFAMLYDESGDRQEMALTGQKARITWVREPDAGRGIGRSVRSVSQIVNTPEDIINAVRNGPEWTEGVVIAYGNHIVGAVNGLLTFDVLDDDPHAPRSGLIGLQFHSGGGWVEFKDIYIRRLDRKPDLSGRFKSKPGPVPAPAVTYKLIARPGPDTPLSQ